MTNMFAKVSARIFILFVLINVETSFALDSKRDVENKQLDEILSWDSDLNLIKTYELEMTKKTHDIFFRLTKSLKSRTNLGNLKKYRQARFGLWGRDLLNLNLEEEDNPKLIGKNTTNPLKLDLKMVMETQKKLILIHFIAIHIC